MVQEHSNVDLNNPEFISTAVCSTSLNVWLPFNPIQSTLTEELPRLAYQLHQQASASVTLLDITHCTPNIAKIKVHNSWATAQWISKWSTVLLLHLHMQHQFTKLKPLLIKLSNISQSRCPYQKSDFLRYFGAPYIIPWESCIIVTTKSLIIIFNMKFSITLPSPPH